MNLSTFEFAKRILYKTDTRLNTQHIVLDVGCGDGNYSTFFSRNAKQVVGIDVNLNSNWLKIKEENVGFLVADAHALPFPDDTFDLVFEKDALHHMEDHQKALGEIVRCTKRKGKILIVEANRQNPFLYFYMTLLRGHQHLRRNYLMKLTCSRRTQNTRFLTVETHMYPVTFRPLFGLFYLFEDLIETIPLIRDFLYYNIAIAQKA